LFNGIRLSQETTLPPITLILKFSWVWFTTRQASVPSYSVDTIATVEFNVCGLHEKWKQVMAHCICHSSTKTKLIMQFCTCI
jgi:hypothetical protein